MDSGYKRLFKSNTDVSFIGLPDIFCPENKIRPGVNVAGWRFVRLMIHLMFKNIKNESFGSSFVFRQRNYSADENRIPGKKLLKRISKNYDDVIFLCDKKSNLHNFYKYYKRSEKIKSKILFVNEDWNINSVKLILKKLKKLRFKRKKQIIFLAYGGASRWAAVPIIEMGYCLIDIGQID